jgi:hypothetical protein
MSSRSGTAGAAPTALRPVTGRKRMVSLLSRFAQLPPSTHVVTLLLNGSVAARIDPGGELDTALALAVEDGRITRIYAIRNPHKLGRLNRVAKLRR